MTTKKRQNLCLEVLIHSGNIPRVVWTVERELPAENETESRIWSLVTKVNQKTSLTGYAVEQGWEIIEPIGPRWVVDLDKGHVRWCRKPIPVNEDQRLAKNPARI